MFDLNANRKEMSITPNVEVIVGTYEGFLLGYKQEFKNGKRDLSLMFADKSHMGVIKCVTVHKKLVATGATDDRIFVYDMNTRTQCQILMTHEGSVNALAFTPDGTHLLSGSDDGQMMATLLKTWAVEATWKKAHGGKAVTHIQCHPSGKLALSLGDDSVLCTWNLVKGRVAYKKNLKTQISMPNNLIWSPDGSYFALSGQQLVQIWSLETADIIRTEKTDSKPSSMCWIDKDVFLVGLENGQIKPVYINEHQYQIPTFQAHRARVKAMNYVNFTLATASSTGELKLWEKNATGIKLTEIVKTDVGFRPTCIGIVDLSQFETIAKSSDVKQDCPVDVNIPQQGILQQQGRVVIEYENEENNSNSARLPQEEDHESKESSQDEDEGNTATEEKETSKKRKNFTKPKKSPKKKSKK